MLALRWLWIAAIVASMYVTYLLLAEIDDELPQVPGRLNAVVLLLFVVAAIIIGTDDLNNRRQLAVEEVNARRHLAQSARLDRIEGLIAAADRRLTAFVRQLDELECRVISFGRRLEVVEQHVREEDTRELPKFRGTASTHYSRVVAQVGSVKQVIQLPDSDVVEAPSQPAGDSTFMEEAAGYYELGRQAGLAERQDPEEK